MATPKIELILSPGACSLAPHILLHETGLNFKTTFIPSITSSTPASESLRAINPKMRVPVLLLDNEVITEAPAIMTAISQLSPSLHLMGKSNLEVVRVYEWLNYLSGTLHGQAFGGLLRPQRYSDDEGAFEGIKEKGRKTVEECFGKIEGDLKAGRWAVGGAFSAVDAFLFVFWRWGVGMGVDMVGMYPKYAGLVREVVKRDSVRKALEAEGVKSFVSVL